MIKNIIFDIGNVLATFSWKSFYHSFNLTDEQFERISQATVKSNVWQELDRGVWSYQQIVDGFVNNDIEDEELIREIHKNLIGVVTRLDYSIDWIKSYKDRGFNCYYLSNYNEHVIRDNPEAIDFLPLLDGGVFSHIVNLIKPDYRIYETLLNKYSLKPEECIFIDDNINNCIAARELGISSVHFVELQQVKDEVEKIILEKV